MDPKVVENHSTDVLVSQVASETTRVGAVTSGVGWLTSNTLIALIGLFIAILGFGVNLFFQHRRDAREQEIHALKIKVFNRSLDEKLEAETPEGAEKVDGA